MWIRGACVLVLVSVLGASADAAPGKAWSITPPEGWADHSPLANQQTTVDEMKTKLAEVGGSYDLGLWETDPDHRLTVLYMRVPAGQETGPGRVKGWEDGARNGVNETAKEVSYKQTQTDQLLTAEQVSKGEGKAQFHSIRFSGLDANNALVGIQASCVGDEPACGAALASLRLDSATFRSLKAAARASKDKESSEISYRIGFAVGIALVLILVVGGIQFKRRRST